MHLAVSEQQSYVKGLTHHSRVMMMISSRTDCDALRGCHEPGVLQRKTLEQRSSVEKCRYAIKVIILVPEFQPFSDHGLNERVHLLLVVLVRNTSEGVKTGTKE